MIFFGEGTQRAPSFLIFQAQSFYLIQMSVQFYLTDFGFEAQGPNDMQVEFNTQGLCFFDEIEITDPIFFSA
jgi:hypothetical protein